jgi:hypothetical protein
MIQENPDKGLAVEFYMQAKENPRKSKEAGRPIYDDVEMVKIIFPGDNKSAHCAPANEMHYVSHHKAQMTYAERFPEHYKVFQAQTEEFVSGTPLQELPSLSAAKRAELIAMNVKTVEQLAGLTNTAAKKCGMGTLDLVSAAKTYLETAQNQTTIQDFQSQIAELEAQLKAAKQTGGAEQSSEISDQFEGMSDTDLRNIIKDAGGSIPDGAKRGKLIETISKLDAEKQKAA